MHSAPSSVQSLHLGLVPSHRDFRDRQISHCSEVSAIEIVRMKDIAYGYCRSPSRIVNASICAPSLQRIYPIIAILPVSILQAVRHRLPISRGLR